MVADTEQNDFENHAGEAIENAEFRSDDGEGNASVMKPRKPTRHHRARDSYYDSENNIGGSGGNQGNGVDDSCKHSKWYIVSASIFVFSSLLYLAMACMIMDYYWFYKEVPKNVMSADDDSTWWNYFINCTDDGHIPEEVAYADDDYAWYDWYNNTAFFEDDNIWLPKVAKETSPGYPESAYVSRYMILYFFAAFGFMITGAIEVVLARHSPLKYRMLYYVMMLAASFGMASAILTNFSPFWSAISNTISCCLWASEAFIIVYQRVRGVFDSDEYEEYDKIFGISIIHWFYLADFSFLVGTVGDSVTSFFYIFGIDNLKLGIFAVIFAVFWLICAIVYLIVAVHDYIAYEKYFVTLDEDDKLDDLEPECAPKMDPSVQQFQKSSHFIEPYDMKDENVQVEEIPVVTAVAVDVS